MALHPGIQPYNSIAFYDYPFVLYYIWPAPFFRLSDELRKSDFSYESYLGWKCESQNNEPQNCANLTVCSPQEYISFQNMYNSMYNSMYNFNFPKIHHLLVCRQKRLATIPICRTDSTFASSEPKEATQTAHVDRTPSLCCDRIHNGLVCFSCVVLLHVQRARGGLRCVFELTKLKSFKVYTAFASLDKLFGMLVWGLWILSLLAWAPASLLAVVRPECVGTFSAVNIFACCWFTSSD